MKKLFIMVAALLFTGACGHPSVGTIYGKDYQPPYETQTMYCATYDSKGICRMWLPRTIHHRECWRIFVQDETDKWTVCVDKPYWESARNEQTWKEAS